jgi:hypothetical protein
MSLALIVLTATFAVLIGGQRDQQVLISKADAVQTASVGVRAMSQDLRQAYDIEFPLAATTANGCVATAGVQPCNIIDVLARLTGTGYPYTDYEVRYDCTVPSTTISGDTACWRYLCSASATTTATSSCLASSTSTLLSARLVIDDLTNGSTPVFSLCYASAITTGAACATGGTATSATVTISTPAAGTLSTAAGGDRSAIVLSDSIYMPDLSYGQ